MKNKIVIVGATISLLGGCMADAPLQEELADEPNQLDVIEQQLGEPGCATTPVSAGGDSDGRSLAYVTGTPNTVASPDWTYRNFPACPFQYLTEYTKIGPATGLGSFVASAGVIGSVNTPLDSIKNKQDCERTRLFVGIHVWTFANSVPTTHTYNGKGKWTSDTIFLPYCDVQKVAGTLDSPSYATSTAKHKIRLATRAVYCSGNCDTALLTDLRVKTTMRWYQDPDTPL